MSDKMRYYNAGRAVPEEAKKPIAAGRLKGFTDISPMWRIKKLTEMFGPVGIGWDVNVTDKRIVANEKTGEIAVFIDINLCFKETEESDWSAPVFGTGGAMFVSVEKENRLYTDDEAFKKAYTDAISVACKAIGIGADVYWNKDADKYGGYGVRSERALELMEEIFGHGSENVVNAMAVKAKGRFVKDLTDEELEAMAAALRKQKQQGAEA